MKRKIKILPALSLAFCLLLSQIAMADTVAAASATVEAKQGTQQEEIKTKISKDEAIKIAKSFKFSEGYKISNIYLNSGDGMSRPVWRIEFSQSQYNTNFSAGISADTGELVNYDAWGQYGRKNIVNISKKEAKAIAEKFMAEYAKTDIKSFEYMPGFETSYEKTGGISDVPQYNFSYCLKVNGIVVSDIKYSINVNASTGKVTGFYTPAMYSDETKYPPAEGIKDLELLKDKYISMVGMQLQYAVLYNNNQTKMRLIYMPSIPGMLNAKTMDTVKDYGYDYNSSLSKSIKYVPINPDVKPENKPITEEQALAGINNLKAYIEKALNIKLSESNGSVRVGNVENQCSKVFNTTSGNQNYGLTISYNLDTGNIISFSFYKYNSNENIDSKKVSEKISYKDAKKISDEIIKRLFPKQYGKFSDNNKETDTLSIYREQQQGYNFSYMRVENGIPVSNFIGVSIDKETGIPSQINMDWSDLEIPDANNIKAADQAKEVYLKNTEFNLEYYAPLLYDKGTLKKADEAVIVYKPNYNVMGYVDARTGKLIDWNGKVMENGSSDENNWAADSIEKLICQGSLNRVPDYDEKLSRQDAVKMLSLTMGIQNFINMPSLEKDSFSDVNKENEYYNYVESAVQNGIIKATGKSFNGTEKITKKEYITMLLDMLGYGEIAKHSELFANTSENNYISICKALEILPVKPGDIFNADDAITLAEAAYSLQKSLKYIR